MVMININVDVNVNIESGMNLGKAFYILRCSYLQSGCENAVIVLSFRAAEVGSWTRGVGVDFFSERFFSCHLGVSGWRSYQVEWGGVWAGVGADGFLINR